jgi:DNA-binding response OmpR family regulator
VNVLLVEDDPGVARFFTTILERAGFQVTPVVTAEDALAALQHTVFHCLVVDLILPRAEGTTFYDEIASSFPEMAARVLFVTGWGKDPKSHALLAHTGRPVLAKPVEATVLIAAVKEIAATGPGPL